MISLNFQKADSLIKLNHNGLDKNYRVLYELIFNSGNNKQIDSINLGRIKKDKRTSSLYYISKAYYNLYYKKREPFFLKHLDSAYIKTNNNKNLHKLSLIALLKFYSKENTSELKTFNRYINKYKEIAETKVDDIWIAYFENMHEGRSVEWNEDFFYKSGRNNIELYNKYSNELSIGLNANLAENIGIHYRVNKRSDSSILFFKRIIELPNYNYLKENKFAAGLDLGEIYVKKKNIKLANYYFNKSLENINVGDKNKNLVTFYKFKAHYFYKPQNLHDSAYFFLNKAFNLNRTINYEENTSNNTKLQVQLKTAEKEKQLLEEQTRRKAEQTQKRQITIGLTATLLLGSIIAFLVYRNTKRKQRIAEQDRELQIQKTETILKEKEIETINAMVSGQEKERLRLASELHDNLGSTLATVRMQVENLERNLDKVENPKALLQKTNALVNEAYKKVRTISHERNSGVLAKDGLLPAIQKLARTISSNNDLQIEVQDFGLENRIANELEITIFRIIQELITNIVKHAQATEANISLTQHDNELNIMVEDNGIGFKVGKLKEKDGMGLGSIERRVEHLEGTMEVDSTPKRGTSVSIDIPL